MVLFRVCFSLCSLLPLLTTPFHLNTIILFANKSSGFGNFLEINRGSCVLLFVYFDLSVLGFQFGVQSMNYTLGLCLIGEVSFR